MPNKEYFANAVKKHGITEGDGANADYLLSEYQKSTQGLDQEVAKQALEGGRMFGESDRKRYDELMAKRGEAKGKAQSHTGNTQVADTKVDQSQEVNQNNDINTNINGDNNTVRNTQDNSVRQYGGSSRVFNYNGGNSGGPDAPASAATMAGFYDVEDSPSANAGRLDRLIDQNTQTQKRLRSIAPESIIEPKQIDKRVQ